MACGYWKAGFQDHEAVFHLLFRENPFGGQFTVACGLPAAIEFLQGFHFSEDEVAWLADRRGNDGAPVFDRGFLEWLGDLRIGCDVDAVAEGTIVFPNEPMMRVSGPMIDCQIIETALLNLLNFQSLIATKAARVCLAAGSDRVIEYGLRRAQGLEGGLSASRAAYIGGCAGTSNLLAGQRYGIPVSGTQAHSWIMFFESETEAFETYARVMPNNAVFLVDTYDSLTGLRRALEAGRGLRARGHEFIGIRLDSGDRVALSIAARRMLDEAGFPSALIVCSGDLDEHAIAEMKARGAKIDVWGVGTKLVTGCPDAALNGIYKLGAVRTPGGKWQPRLKLSDEPGKTSCPGRLQVRRSRDAQGQFVGDAIYDLETGLTDPGACVDLTTGALLEIKGVTESFDLLAPVLRGGGLVGAFPSIEQSRQLAQRQLASLPPATRQLQNPTPYPVGLESALYRLREDLISRAREPAEEQE